MIDYQRIFHVGLRVDDIEAAMDELGPGLGVTWCELQRRPQSLWTPEGGSQEVDLRFVYSREGPQHVELLQAPEGTPWHPEGSPGVHHVGIWSDDVAGDTERLAASGWTVALAQVPPEDGYGVFTYCRPPNGMLVELVDARMESRFDAWFAGGSL